MRYLIVRADARELFAQEAADFEAALWLAGLQPGKIDHGGLIAGWLHTAVYEFGMYEEERFFWSFGRMMFAGNGVVYQIDDQGNTVDLDSRREALLRRMIRFDSREGMEMRIRAGTVERPIVRVNGEEIWSWPNPRPDLESVVEKVSGADTVTIGDVVIMKGRKL